MEVRETSCWSARVEASLPGRDFGNSDTSKDENLPPPHTPPTTQPLHTNLFVRSLFITVLFSAWFLAKSVKHPRNKLPYFSSSEDEKEIPLVEVLSFHSHFRLNRKLCEQEFILFVS